MVGKFELIRDGLDLNLIRELAELKDDEALRLSFTCMICEVIGGIKMMPVKKHKVELARALVKQNVDKNRVLALSGIARSTYYELRKDSEK